MLNPDYIPWPIALIVFVILMGILAYQHIRDRKVRMEFETQLDIYAIVSKRQANIENRRHIFEIQQQERIARYRNSPTPLFDQMAFEGPNRAIKELI